MESHYGQSRKNAYGKTPDGTESNRITGDERQRINSEIEDSNKRPASLHAEIKPPVTSKIKPQKQTQTPAVEKPSYQAPPKRDLDAATVRKAAMLSLSTFITAGDESDTKLSRDACLLLFRSNTADTFVREALDIPSKLNVDLSGFMRGLGETAIITIQESVLG